VAIVGGGAIVSGGAIVGGAGGIVSGGTIGGGGAVVSGHRVRCVTRVSFSPGVEVVAASITLVESADNTRQSFHGVPELDTGLVHPRVGSGRVRLFQVH